MNQLIQGKPGEVIYSALTTHCRETYDRAEAYKTVEANGYGTVVKFLVRLNISGCQPTHVYDCVSADVYDNGKWRPIPLM